MSQLQHVGAAKTLAVAKRSSRPRLSNFNLKQRRPEWKSLSFVRLYGAQSIGVHSVLHQNNSALFFDPAADPSTSFHFYFYFLVFVSPHLAYLCYSYLGGETTVRPVHKFNLLLLCYCVKSLGHGDGSYPVHSSWHPHVPEIPLCLKHGRYSKTSAGNIQHLGARSNLQCDFERMNTLVQSSVGQ